jgi:hypothetical protein
VKPTIPLLERFSKEPHLHRFWAKVTKGGPDECWPWQGDRNKAGYGMVTSNAGGQRRRFLTHRISLTLHLGRELGEYRALHSCDNPPCVNPTHLRPGTDADNIRDKVDRGRMCSEYPKRPRPTHCRRGHEFTSENSRVHSGVRNCRTCERQALNDRRARRRAKKAAR